MNDDVLAAIQADDDQGPKQLEASNLSHLSELANRQLQLEDDLQAAELHAKDIKAAIRKVSCSEIPQYMEQFGISEFKLTDGSKISVVDDTYASITKDNATKAMLWLEENGHSGLIKKKLTLSFGKGEYDDAEHAKDLLNEAKISYDETEGVHHSTLKSWVKDMLSEGQEIPLDLFGVFQGFKTKIK